MQRLHRVLIVLFFLSWLPFTGSGSVAAQEPGCNRVDILAQNAYTFSFSPGWTVRLSNDVRFMPGVGFSSDELWHVGGTETKLPLYPSEFVRQNVGSSTVIERVENRSASVAGILVICYERLWTPSPTPTNVPGAEGCGVWTIPNTATTFAAPTVDLIVWSLEGVVEVWIGPDWLDIPTYAGTVDNSGYRWLAGYMEDLRSSAETPNAKLLVCEAPPLPTATSTATATATPAPSIDCLYSTHTAFSGMTGWGSSWTFAVFDADLATVSSVGSDNNTYTNTNGDHVFLTGDWFGWWVQLLDEDGSLHQSNDTVQVYIDSNVNAGVHIYAGSGAFSSVPTQVTAHTSYIYLIQGPGDNDGTWNVRICPYDPLDTEPTATPTATNTATAGPSPTATNTATIGPSPTATRTPRPTNTPIATQSIATITPTTCNSCARSATQLALQETEVALLQTMVAQGTQGIVFPSPLPSSTPTATSVPVTIQFEEDAYSVDEDTATGLVTLTVTLSAPLSVPVSVDYSSSDAGATAGVDYQRSVGVITFDPGETEQVITIPIIDDIHLEQPELVRVDLGMRVDPAYAGLTLAPTSSALVTIFDNDAAPWELPGCWTGLATHPSVTLVLTATSRLWVFRGEEGYMLRNGIWARIPEFGTSPFTIPASSLDVHPAPQFRSAAFIVCPVTDPILLTPTAGVGGPALSFSLDVYTVREDAGFITVTIQLAPPSTDVVEVSYDTIDGTAIDPDDYTGTFSAVEFQPGEIIKQVAIPIIDDGLVEPDEDFSIVLSDPVNAIVAAPITMVIIQSVDVPLEVKFDSTNFLYMVNEDAGFVSIQLELSEAAPQEVSVRVTLTEGSALYAVDYVGILEDITEFEVGLETLVVTFAVGEQTKILQIGIVNDAVAESDEMFAVTFSEPSAGVVLDEFPSSAVQIKDNDRIGGDGGGERWSVPPGCEVLIVEQPVSIIRLYRDSLVTPLNGNVELAGDTLYTLVVTQQYIIPEGNYLASPLIGGTVEVQLEVCPYFPVSNAPTSVALIQGYEPFRSASLFIAAGQTSVARFNTIPTANTVDGPSDAQILPGATYQPASWVVVPTLESTVFPQALPSQAGALVTQNLPSAVRLTIGWAWPIVQFVRLVTTISMLWALWRYVRGVVLRVRH